MRAQLRTYHPIPSLQTYSDQSDYKQLQDAPRLKSILKGACEDEPEPATLEELEESSKFPRTNPINLCFLISTFANKIQTKFFVPPYEFHDLIMNKSLTSESRGRAFLWLMWAFLETDLSSESLKQNPFGPGQNDGHCVPEFTTMTSEQVLKENIDSPEELAFGATMTKERKIYIDAAAQLPNSAPTAGGSGGGSGNSVKLKMKEISSHSKALEATGSPEPLTASRRSSVSSGESDLEDAGHDNDKSRSPSPARLRLILKAPNRSVGGSRTKQDTNAIKTQAAFREAKCQLEIQKLLRRKDKRNRNQRYRLGPLLREWNKIKNVDSLYDSDKDDFPRNPDESTIGTNSVGASKNRRKKVFTESETSTNGNLQSNGSLEQGPGSTSAVFAGSANRKMDLPGDYGEESTAMATAFRRSYRWLGRWADNKGQLSSTHDFVEPERLARRARQLSREAIEIRQIEASLQEEKEKASIIEKELEQIREKESAQKSQNEDTIIPSGGKTTSRAKASKASSKKRKQNGEDNISVTETEGVEDTDKKKVAPRRPRKRKDSSEAGSVEKKLKISDTAVASMLSPHADVPTHPIADSTSQAGENAPQKESPSSDVPSQTAVYEEMSPQQPRPQSQTRDSSLNGSPPSVMSLGNLLD